MAKRLTMPAIIGFIHMSPNWQLHGGYLNKLQIAELRVRCLGGPGADRMASVSSFEINWANTVMSLTQ
jgi:hypothetical protein